MPICKALCHLFFNWHFSAESPYSASFSCAATENAQSNKTCFWISSVDFAITFSLVKYSQNSSQLWCFRLFHNPWTISEMFSLWRWMPPPAMHLILTWMMPQIWHRFSDLLSLSEDFWWRSAGLTPWALNQQQALLCRQMFALSSPADNAPEGLCMSMLLSSFSLLLKFSTAWSGQTLKKNRTVIYPFVLYFVVHVPVKSEGDRVKSMRLYLG